MKAFLRRCLSAVGLRVMRTNHPAARYVDHMPGSPLDFLILSHFPALHGLRFLQIGGHDGVRNDPIHRWIRDCGWTGCVVEPMPDFADRLRKLHAQRPGIRVLECAIADNPGSTLLYRIDSPGTDLPEWAEGVATLDRARAVEAAQALGLSADALVTQSVTSITMAELLSRFRSPGPDIVVIDTEGYDIRLASALLDQGCRPTLLHFEHACAPASDWWPLLQRLHGLGYDVAIHGADTTAYRRS